MTSPIEEEDDDDDVFCVGQLSFGEGVFQTQLSTIVHDRLPARSKQNCAKAQIIDSTSLLHCFYFCPQLAWSRSKFLCLCYSTSLGDNCVERNNELTDLET